MAIWIRTPGMVTCYRGKCGVSIPPGELVCLVSTAKLPACRRCALKEFGYEAPTDMPALPAPRVQAVPADSAEPRGWTKYDRRTTVKKLLTDRQLKEANAVDPKLKQLGGDR